MDCTSVEKISVDGKGISLELGGRIQNDGFNYSRARKEDTLFKGPPVENGVSEARNGVKVAANLNVSVSTVYRTITFFLRTGNVSPSKRAYRSNRCLTEEDELLVIGLILENPAMYMDELVFEIKTLLEVDISCSTVCRLLKRYGITRKKMRHIAKQRCYSLRGMYISHISNFDKSMFVWLDETGTDKRDQLRKYGYAIRGITPTCHRSLSRGERINAIASMSIEGMITLELVTGSVNGDIFFDFLRGSLIPNMQPFPNSRSVLLMDNCSIHHTEDVVALLKQAGIITVYLPPYSPDLMPLEETFSYIKNYLKRHDELLQVITDPRDIIKEAFKSITKENCHAWICHAGYNSI